MTRKKNTYFYAFSSFAWPEMWEVRINKKQLKVLIKEIEKKVFLFSLGEEEAYAKTAEEKFVVTFDGFNWKKKEKNNDEQ